MHQSRNGERPKNSARELREQRHQAEGRLVQQMLRAFEAVDAHSGLKCSVPGAALRTALAGTQSRTTQQSVPTAAKVLSELLPTPSHSVQQSAPACREVG